MKKLLTLSALVTASAVTQAAVIIVNPNPVSATVGSATTIQLRAQGDGSTIGISGRMNFPAGYTVTATPVAGISINGCNVNANQVIFSFVNNGNAVIPNATGQNGLAHCDVSLTPPASAMSGMNLDFPAATMACSDAMGNKVTPCTGTTTPINIVVPNSSIGSAPASLTFTGVPNGTQSAPQNVTLTNTSNPTPTPPALTVSGCTLGGTNPTAFAFTGPTFPATIPVAGNIAVAVRCTPPAGPAAGNFTATLTCNSNATTGTANPVTNLSCASVAEAPPAITYNPTPTTTVNLTGASTLTGATANATITATPSGGNGTGANNTTTVNTCTIAGAGAAAFGSVAGVNLSFIGNTTTAGNIPLSCVRVFNAAQNATLTCQERRGAAAAVNQTWPIVCPAGTGSAGFASAPVAGDLPLLQAAVGATATTTINMSNPGQLPTTVTCTAPNAPFSASPLTFTLAAGASQVVTVSFTGQFQGGVNGTLTCAISGQGLTTFNAVYNLRGFALNTIAVPTLGEFGRWMLLGLVAGLGAFVAFRKR
jgi:hypothetical protein